MTETTFTPRRVINIHAHITQGADVDEKIRVWKEQGAVRTCVLAIAPIKGPGNWRVLSNEQLTPHLARHSDHLIGFGGLDLTLEPDKPEVVAELKQMGYRGLKAIRPCKPYDDDLFMPLYEAAAKHEMPILFHTGLLAFRPDYRGPSRNDYMRPMHLERIARYFPHLTLIGAHLGMPWPSEAVRLLLSRPNVYYDISGGSGSARHGTFIKQALAPFPNADPTDPDQHLALKLFAGKLLFGTDNPPLSTWVPRAQDILDYLQIPEDVQENFYWRSAAKLLGLVELL